MKIGKRNPICSFWS